MDEAKGKEVEEGEEVKEIKEQIHRSLDTAGAEGAACYRLVVRFERGFV